MTRPSRASPSSSARASELTATIAADAERDAGEEDAQAREPAAQIAKREARENEARATRQRGTRLAHASAGAAASITPERMRSVRSQRAASAGSWVTSASVAPRSRGQREQEIDDRAPGRLVEIAGRLVGDQQRGPRRQRARERDALLLAARELGGIMAAAARRGRPAPVPLAARAKASRAPASSSGAATFSSAVIVGMRWNDWKTMPIRAPRNRASASSLMRWMATPSTRIAPLSGRSSPAMVISSVDLPEPDGADEADRLARCDCQTDVAQYMHPGRAFAEAQVDVAQFDRRSRHREENPSAGERLIWAFAHPRPAVRRWRSRRRSALPPRRPRRGR